jgi:hypothetical protein
MALKLTIVEHKQQKLNLYKREEGDYCLFFSTNNRNKFNKQFVDLSLQELIDARDRLTKVINEAVDKR